MFLSLPSISQSDISNIDYYGGMILSTYQSDVIDLHYVDMILSIYQRDVIGLHYVDMILSIYQSDITSLNYVGMILSIPQNFTDHFQQYMLPRYYQYLLA